jgi:hypothetical protein
VGATDVGGPGRPRWARWLYGVFAAVAGLAGVVIGLAAIVLTGVSGFGLVAGDDCPPEAMCEGLGQAVVGAAFMVGLFGLIVGFVLCAAAYSASWAARDRRREGPPKRRIDPGSAVGR